MFSTSDIIWAARNRKAWGFMAARQFCAKRSIPMRLYYLACTLEAAQKAGF